MKRAGVAEVGCQNSEFWEMYTGTLDLYLRDK